MKLKSVLTPLIFITIILGLSSFLERGERIIRITGVRFSYPLVEHWIESYNKANPEVQVVIEWRGSQDPSGYDILIESYQHPAEIRKQREYINLARYAILPVANGQSDFAKTYSVKGLTRETIQQIYFHDLYADRDKQQAISVPFTTYTRLQKAGAPQVFANYFGYEQKDIKGKGVAGSDEHLLKAVLRDSTGVSYLPLSVIYDRSTGRPVSGLTVIPVDLNGNGRLSDDERFYDNLSDVIRRLGSTNSKDVNSVPIELLHFSVDRNHASPEAISFIRWVLENGLTDLDRFGYLQPGPAGTQMDKFEEFAAQLAHSGKH